jgi:hypothetical protein
MKNFHGLDRARGYGLQHGLTSKINRFSGKLKEDSEILSSKKVYSTQLFVIYLKKDENLHFLKTV